MGGSVPEIPGIKAERHLADHFRKEVAQLLGRRGLGFPGAQPVSFARRHIAELQSQDYYVCEKSDGIRCLMYFTENEDGEEIHYLIDRKNDYYYVKGLHFPVPNDDSFQNFHIGTIIDGELVNDRLPNGGMQLRYLVFDCLILDDNSLMHRTLDKRLAYFRDKVYNPYKALYQKYPEELQFLPFQVEFKNMEFSYGIEMMFREVLPKLPHGNDGLIFTARNQPYKFGTDEHILKWKPETENSVDFRLTLDFPFRDPDSEEEEEGETEPVPDWEAMPTFVLSVHHGDREYREYGKMYVTDEEWEDLKALNRPLQETIVECGQDSQHRWRFLRFRDDKNDANHISTVVSVMESIEDRVGKQDLLAAAKKIRDEWKRRQAEEKGGDVRKRQQEEEIRRRKQEEEQQQRRKEEEMRRRQYEEERRREAERRRMDNAEYRRRQSEDRFSQGDPNGIDDDEYDGPRYAESTDNEDDDVRGNQGRSERSASVVEPSINGRPSPAGKRKASEGQVGGTDGDPVSPSKRQKTEELGNVKGWTMAEQINGRAASPKRKAEDGDGHIRGGSPSKKMRTVEDDEDDQAARRKSSNISNYNNSASSPKRVGKQKTTTTNGHSTDPDQQTEVNNIDEEAVRSLSKGSLKGGSTQNHHHQHHINGGDGDGEGGLSSSEQHGVDVDEVSTGADTGTDEPTATSSKLTSKRDERKEDMKTTISEDGDGNHRKSSDEEESTRKRMASGDELT
ncbi:MAG: hypothetical protein M1823_001688 [Watsoniomyces obsoletus]|nr:MAG: hypothetical protein M1823_001688 [Watsoniomyces obsoletus]